MDILFPFLPFREGKLSLSAVYNLSPGVFFSRAKINNVDVQASFWPVEQLEHSLEQGWHCWNTSWNTLANKSVATRLPAEGAFAFSSAVANKNVNWKCQALLKKSRLRFKDRLQKRGSTRSSNKESKFTLTFLRIFLSLCAEFRKSSMTGKNGRPEMAIFYANKSGRRYEDKNVCRHESAS